MLWHRNLLDAMEFDPRARTKWYVVDRHRNRGVVSQKMSRESAIGVQASNGS